jgi:hypothetical protein
MLTRRSVVGSLIAASLVTPAFPQGAVPERLSFYEEYEFNRVWMVREVPGQKAEGSAQQPGDKQTAGNGESPRGLILRGEGKTEDLVEGREGDKIQSNQWNPSPGEDSSAKPSQNGTQSAATGASSRSQGAAVAGIPGFLALHGRGSFEFIDDDKTLVVVPYRSVVSLLYEFTTRPSWLGPAPEPVQEKKNWKQRLLSLVRFEGEEAHHYLTVRYGTEKGPEVLILRLDHAQREYLVRTLEMRTGRLAERSTTGIMLASRD